VTYDPGHQCELCGNQFEVTVRRPGLGPSPVNAHLCSSHFRQFLAWGQFLVMLGVIYDVGDGQLKGDDLAAWPQSRADKVLVQRGRRR